MLGFAVLLAVDLCMATWLLDSAVTPLALTFSLQGQASSFADRMRSDLHGWHSGAAAWLPGRSAVLAHPWPPPNRLALCLYIIVALNADFSCA